MRRSIIAIIAVTLGTIVALSSATALAAPTGGIGGRPANPDPKNPRTDTIFIYTLNHGDAKQDQVIVSNNTDATQTIELYTVDGVVTNTGAYTCKQESESRADIGAWLQLAKSEVTLKSGKSEKIDFTLTMPNNADVGEHDGCIVFQSKDDTGKISGNVRIRTRQAIRVVATIPGELRRDIKIDSFAVTKSDTGRKFSLQLSNTGNVSADVDTYANLKTLWGSEYYKNGGGYPVLANEKLSLTFDINKHPLLGGWYIASADIGYDKRAGTFGTSDVSKLIHKSSSSRVVYIPPTTLGKIIILLILLAIAAAIGWLLWLRKQAKTVKLEWQVYTIRKGDTLESLARHYNVDWRKLAHANKIRAPYVLKPGTEIRTPVTKPVDEQAVTSPKKG